MFLIVIQPLMSSDALKKRKSKVLRSEAGTLEMKRGRGEEQQVKLQFAHLITKFVVSTL